MDTPGQWRTRCELPGRSNVNFGTFHTDGEPAERRNCEAHRPAACPDNYEYNIPGPCLASGRLQAKALIEDVFGRLTGSVYTVSRVSSQILRWTPPLRGNERTRGTAEYEGEKLKKKTGHWFYHVILIAVYIFLASLLLISRETYPNSSVTSSPTDRMQKGGTTRGHRSVRKKKISFLSHFVTFLPHPMMQWNMDGPLWTAAACKRKELSLALQCCRGSRQLAF